MGRQWIKDHDLLSSAVERSAEVSRPLQVGGHGGGVRERDVFVEALVTHHEESLVAADRTAEHSFGVVVLVTVDARAGIDVLNGLGVERSAAIHESIREAEVVGSCF